MATLNNQQRLEGGAQIPLWETIIKMIVGLIAAAIIPTVIFVLIILLVLGFISFSGIITKGAFTLEAFANAASAAGYAIAIAFFFGAWALIIAAGQVAILGFPAAIIGWHLGLIR